MFCVFSPYQNGELVQPAWSMVLPLWHCDACFSFWCTRSIATNKYRTDKILSFHLKSSSYKRTLQRSDGYRDLPFNIILLHRDIVLLWRPHEVISVLHLLSKLGCQDTCPLQTLGFFFWAATVDADQVHCIRQRHLDQTKPFVENSVRCVLSQSEFTHRRNQKDCSSVDMDAPEMWSRAPCLWPARSTRLSQRRATPPGQRAGRCLSVAGAPRAGPDGSLGPDGTGW